MEYEKAYKEAIESIKRIYDQADSYGKELMRKEFPELRESEDERIRKEIISFITDARNWFPKEETKSSWIAWLEKQATPQLRTGPEWVNTIDDACDKRYSEEYAHGEYCHEQSFKWGFQEGVDWLEKQGKQKYAWSEEDEDVINHLLDICAGAKKYRQFAGCLQEDITKYQTWLKSIKPQQNQYDKGYNDGYSAAKYNHWKPSEEQMETEFSNFYNRYDSDEVYSRY